MPWSSEAWLRLGDAETTQGDIPDARVSIRTAISKAPLEWRPWLSLLRLTSGGTQGRALKQAARLNPHAPEVVHFLLAPGSLIEETSYADSWHGWPVAPVHQQHEIRSAFLDPRAGMLRVGGDPTYHFGIDVAVRDDRPEADAPAGRTHRVYAVEGGKAVLPPWASSAPCVDRRVEVGHFEYWHVDTSGVLAQGQYVHPGQMIGWTCKGLWHVHLSEWMELYGRRVYVNPLRPGTKLRPYDDRAPPRIHSIEFFRPAMPTWSDPPRVSFASAGTRFPTTTSGRALLSGRVDVRAWIDDATPVRAGSPAVSPSPPYSVALRVIRATDGRPVLDRTVFRAALLLSDSAATQSVPISYHYAPGTTRTRTYWLRLFARPTQAYWDTSRIANGDYNLQVTARDAAGNVATATARMTVRN
jgi:hypothetical protein